MTISEYAPIGITAAVVLSSVALYFVFNRGPTELSPVQKLQLQLDNFNKKYDSYLDQIEEYYKEHFDNTEDRIYKCNYFQEELLKLLISLDGVNLLSIENDEEARLDLKAQRKALIKQIQLKQKDLDKFKETSTV